MKKGIFQLLSSNGDGTGTSDAIGDYSATPLSLKISANDGYAFIERMIVKIEDSGTLDSGKYGNGIDITNGIRVYLKNRANQVMQEFTAFPIITFGDWQGHCHDLNHINFGSGNEIVSVRWTFSKSGQPIGINFEAGEYLEVYLNDNFTGLVHHRFTVQGMMTDKI